MSCNYQHELEPTYPHSSDRSQTKHHNINKCVSDSAQIYSAEAVRACFSLAEATAINILLTSTINEMMRCNVLLVLTHSKNYHWTQLCAVFDCLLARLLSWPAGLLFCFILTALIKSLLAVVRLFTGCL